MPTQCSINAHNPLQQVVFSSTGAAISCTTFPFDNTIPQQTDGTQILTCTITPRLATNYLEIEFSTLVANGNTVIAALFQDAGADAIAATCVDTHYGQSNLLQLKHFMVAGTTSATTFKIRIGAQITSCDVNSDNTPTRLYGGVANTTLSIKEFAV